MTTTWVDFFGLTGDPFAQRALQTSGDFEYLFVKTEDIANYVDPLVEHFDSSEPFLRVIEGERGTGKSTIMHYMIQQLRDKALACYIPYQYSAIIGQRDPRYGVGADTLLQIALALGRKINSNSVYSGHSQKIQEVFSALGANKETGIQERNPPPYAVVEGRLNEILDIIEKENIRALVAVDNYDRLSKDVAIEFWKSNLAQGPISDRLVGAGVSVVFSAKTGWIPRIGVDPDLSYLGEPIRILSLNDFAAKELLLRRFTNKAKKDSPFPFTDDAVLEITKRMNGVPRFMLETARTLLIEAARKPKQTRTIDGPFVTQVIESLGERQERYYEAIEDDPAASRGYGALHTLRGRVDAEKFPKLLSALALVFESKPVDLNQLEELRANGIVWLGSERSPGEREIMIASNVEALLSKIKSERLSVPRFLEWFAKVDIPSTLHVSVQREEVREEIVNLLRQTARSIGNEQIKQQVNIAVTAYRALDASLQSPDLDYPQILQHLWLCIYHLAVANYSLYLALDEKRIPPKKVNSEELDDFLSGLKTYRELLIDFGILRTYYLASLKESYPESVQEPVQKFHRAAAALTDVLVRRVESMSEVGRRIPEIRIGSVEALANQLKHELYPLQQDGRYTFVYRGDLPTEQFPPTIAWSFRSEIYCISYTPRELLQGMGVLSYESRLNWRWLPPEVKSQISLNNFRKYGSGCRLWFQNAIEFANAIGKMAGDGILVLQIHKPDTTTVYGISRRAGAFELSRENRGSQHGIMFNPLYVFKHPHSISTSEPVSEPKLNDSARDKGPRQLLEKKIRAGQKAAADAVIGEWFGRFQGEVIGELMFVDKTTFAYLDMIPMGCGIRLIVGHIDDDKSCIEYAKKQCIGRPYFKITQIEFPSPDPQYPRTVHERWLADDEIQVDFGTDLKGNAIGKNEHTITVTEKSRESERARDFEFKANCSEVDLRRVYGNDAKRSVLFNFERPS